MGRFALLAAIGLCAASFLSFPVAAFFALSVLFIGLSSGTPENSAASNINEKTRQLRRSIDTSEKQQPRLADHNRRCQMFNSIQ